MRTFSPALAIALLLFSSTVLFVAPGCRERRRADDGTRPAGSASALPAVVYSRPPDVVSSASPGGTGADAGPALVPAETVDGAALRTAHRARIAADASAVTILTGGGARSLGEELCAAVVPTRPHPEDVPVLVKPNLGGFEWFKDPARSNGDDGVHGRTTDPEFVRGIVRCLKKRGHRRITIAEGWGAKHADWKRLVKVSGYEAMAAEESVPLVAMDDDGVFDVEGERPGKPLRVLGMEETRVPTLLMPKILAEHLQHGMFISAPKIKAHRFGVVSMAIKGMQGTVMLSDASPAFHQKWRTHRELGDALALLPSDRAAGNKAYLDALEIFAERMVDVLEVAAPDVVLAEGAPAMGGDGFARRWPSQEDLAIGGTNPILVDRVGAAALGLWDNADLARELGGHRTSPLVEAAARRFGVDATRPTLAGAGKELLGTPRPVHFVSMSGFELHSDASGAEAAPRGAVRDASAPLEAHARHVDQPFTIDGHVDTAWASVPPVSFSTDWSGTETRIRTVVRIAWSAAALYALWELEEAGVHADATRPVDTERAKLYEEDCVELFVAPDAHTPRRYYEVEVGPLGHFLDIAVDRTATRSKSDVGWSSRPTIASSVDRTKRRVTIEMALSAPEIVSALRPGATLPLALYRMEGAPPQRSYLAWSPTKTPRPDFHVPEAFGRLTLDRAVDRTSLDAGAGDASRRR